MAGGRGGGIERPRRGGGYSVREGYGAAGAGELIDSRPRDTLYLSSHRCPLAGPTKKEIGFADFDPFVFGQRPAMRAGAEKCEGALIGHAGPAPPLCPARSLRRRLAEPPRSVQGRLPARTLICLGSSIYTRIKHN